MLVIMLVAVVEVYVCVIGLLAVSVNVGVYLPAAFTGGAEGRVYSERDQHQRDRQLHPRLDLFRYGYF